MDTKQTTAQALTETGVYRFQRALDAACVARVAQRVGRQLTPEDIERLLEAQS